VRLDRFFRQKKNLADLCVRQPLCRQFQHLQFPLAQLADRILATAKRDHNRPLILRHPLFRQDRGALQWWRQRTRLDKVHRFPDRNRHLFGKHQSEGILWLRILRDEGLLEFRRGRGITVVYSPERGAVLAKAKDLLHQLIGSAEKLRAGSAWQHLRAPEERYSS
jgi:hypothetical protein